MFIGVQISKLLIKLCNQAHSLQTFEYNINSGYFKDVY